MPITPEPLRIQVYCKDCGTYLKARWSEVFGEISIEPCQCPLNEIRKVYEKYKHMDTCFSDRDFAGLWQAIKVSLEPGENNG